MAGAVLGELRGAKSAAKVGMKATIERAAVTDTAARLELLRSVLDDVGQAGRVDAFELSDGDEFTVDCVVVPPAES